MIKRAEDSPTGQSISRQFYENIFSVFANVCRHLCMVSRQMMPFASREWSKCKPGDSL
jgi:hypothetical protein